MFTHSQCEDPKMHEGNQNNATSAVLLDASLCAPSLAGTRKARARWKCPFGDAGLSRTHAWQRKKSPFSARDPFFSARECRMSHTLIVFLKFLDLLFSWRGLGVLDDPCPILDLRPARRPGSRINARWFSPFTSSSE